MRLTSLGLLSTIATGKSLFTFTNGEFFNQSEKSIKMGFYWVTVMLGRSVGAKMDTND